MKNNNPKKIVSIDTSKLTKEQLALLTSLVNENDTSQFLSEEMGCKIVATILKKLRKKCGISQTDIAQKVGYDYPQFISNIERGASKVPIDKARLFVTAYDADEKLYPAIIKLCHHSEWFIVLDIVEMAGADSPSFDNSIQEWIVENQ